MFQLESGHTVVIENGRHMVTKTPTDQGKIPEFITLSMLAEPTATQVVEILEAIVDECKLNMYEAKHC